MKLLKFEQNTETFEALRDGRGDALSNDNTFLFAWAKQNPGYTVGVKTLVIKMLLHQLFAKMHLNC